MKIRKIKKKAIAMPFNWIFALVAGGVILFLSIYAAGKFIQTGQQTISTETAARFISLFDPLETGLAAGKAQSITFRKKSKISFDCIEDYRFFGRQRLNFTEQTFGKKYGETGAEISIKDKYVFTGSILEGKTFYLFSKPFFMPFKVIDQTFVLSDNYCFYDAPRYIEDELAGLKLGNVFFPNETETCQGINVCFEEGDLGCQIIVYENQGYVSNRIYGERVYFVGDLIYGAIFSHPEIYECNVKRMKRRFDQLAEIYLDKIDIVKRANCESNVGPKLRTVIGDIGNSRELAGLYNEIEEIRLINDAASCKLYYNDRFGE